MLRNEEWLENKHVLGFKIVIYPGLFTMEINGILDNPTIIGVDMQWQMYISDYKHMEWGQYFYVPDMYSIPDQEGVPATFQVLNFIAWKPDPSQVTFS
jgi:hypothetical protein